MPLLQFNAKARSGNSTKTVVEARSFTIVVDEPPSLGGNDEGANPVIRSLKQRWELSAGLWQTNGRLPSCYSGRPLGLVGVGDEVDGGVGRAAVTGMLDL